MSSSDVNLFPSIHSSREFKVKKVAYRGHVAIVHSLEDIEKVMVLIRRKFKFIDAMPYAFHLASLESDEVRAVDHLEDDGDWGAGNILLECLKSKKREFIFLAVTRHVGGCFPPELVQMVKPTMIKDAANAALQLLHDAES